jgi:hypothetical protein
MTKLEAAQPKQEPAHETFDKCVAIANSYGVLEGRAFDMVSAILQTALASPPSPAVPVTGDAKEIADRLRAVEGDNRRLCLDAAMMVEYLHGKTSPAVPVKPLAAARQAYLDAVKLYNARREIMLSKPLGSMRIDDEFRAIDERRREFDRIAIELADAYLASPPSDDVEQLRAKNARLTRLFDQQWKRTREAGELWRQAHPGNDDVSPDLGELVKWLMDRATAAEARERVLVEALLSVPKKPGVTCTSSDWEQDDEAQGWSDAFHTKHMRSCRSDAYNRGYNAGKAARAALEQVKP